jgi:predicted amidohydrolase
VGSEKSPVPTSSGGQALPIPPIAEIRVAGFQMVIQEDDVAANEQSIHRAIDLAADVKADFLLTPEGSVSGYNASFDGKAVADAVERLAAHAKSRGVGLLLGTCWKESSFDFSFPFQMRATPIAQFGRREFCYNQVRVYSPEGEFLGAHAKIQLVDSVRHPGVGEPSGYTPGKLRTFTWKGIPFGVLICNDLWGGQFAAIPNNLAVRLWQMGAQVIFQSVYSGFGRASGDAPMTQYYESCLQRCAAELLTPIVTVNAADPERPVNARSGVWDAGGVHLVATEDVGEQFFVHSVPIRPQF